MMENEGKQPSKTFSEIFDILKKNVRSTSQDDLAQQELDQKYNENKRSEYLKESIHKAINRAIILIEILFYLLLVVRITHFILPICWYWLTEKQLHDIERIVFSGIIISLATRYFKGKGVLDKD